MEKGNRCPCCGSTNISVDFAKKDGMVCLTCDSYFKIDYLMYEITKDEFEDNYELLSCYLELDGWCRFRN